MLIEPLNFTLCKKSMLLKSLKMYTCVLFGMDNYNLYSILCVRGPFCQQTIVSSNQNLDGQFWTILSSVGRSASLEYIFVLQSAFFCKFWILFERTACIIAIDFKYWVILKVHRWSVQMRHGVRTHSIEIPIYAHKMYWCSEPVKRFCMNVKKLYTLFRVHSHTNKVCNVRSLSLSFSVTK